MTFHGVGEGRGLDPSGGEGGRGVDPSGGSGCGMGGLESIEGSVDGVGTEASACALPASRAPGDAPPVPAMTPSSGNIGRQSQTKKANASALGTAIRRWRCMESPFGTAGCLLDFANCYARRVVVGGLKGPARCDRNWSKPVCERRRSNFDSAHVLRLASCRGPPSHTASASEAETQLHEPPAPGFKFKHQGSTGWIERHVGASQLGDAKLDPATLRAAIGGAEPLWMLHSDFLVDRALIFLRSDVHLLSYLAGSLDAIGELVLQNAVARPHWPVWIHLDGIDMPVARSTTPDEMPKNENPGKGN